MNVTQREKFRLWFSYLKIAQTDPPFLRGAIDWTRYEGWGPIQTSASFEKWWNNYGRTLQNPVVREVLLMPDVPPPNTIYLEVPLNRSPRRLAARARHIIEKRITQAYQDRVRTKGEKRPTFKRGFYASAWFTEGREIRMDYYRNLLDLYEAVFKDHPGAVGVKTLAALNAVGSKNAKRNGENAARGVRRLRPEFRQYTTWHQTDEQLEDVVERVVLEPYKSFAKRTREARDEQIAKGTIDRFVDELSTGTVYVRRQETKVDKRVDYLNNPCATSAIQNLRRAKDALRTVVNAVARGEFPGPSGR